MVIGVNNRTHNIVLALLLVAVFGSLITLTYYSTPKANATITATPQPISHDLRNGDVYTVCNGLPSKALIFTGTSEINGFSDTTFTFCYIFGSSEHTIFTHFLTPFYFEEKEFKVTGYDRVSDTVTIEEVR